MRYALFDGITGEIKQTLSCGAETAIANAIRLSLEVIPLSAEITGAHDWIDVSTKELVIAPASPSPHHVFDYTTKQWVDPRTLADLKEAKWLEIKAARDAAEFGSFTWDNSTFDSDPTSQSRIQGAAQLATLALMNSQPFSIDWTLADNSTRVLTAQDMLAVGTAMGVHTNTQHVKARLKRDMINAATTAEEIAAITW